MDSSKRHWPSMFKSKPSVNSHLHQWQHDITPLISTAAATNSLRPYITSSVLSEERTPDPKPRWNPKPEQIRILEGIFNSGMVNPPREEIRRIRAQLQEYGQVGDANVFYWFQNRKSRSKNKKNNPQNTHTKSHTNSFSPHAKTSSASAAAATAAPLSFSSSSSSDKSSAEKKDFSSNVLDGLNSPTCSVNQPYFRTTTSPGGFLPEPYLFPASQSSLVGGDTQQGFFLPELVSSNDYVGHNDYVSNGQTSSVNCSAGLLLTDLMNLGAMNDYYKRAEDNDKVYTQLSYSGVTTTTTAATPTISAQTILHPTISPTLMSTINHTQGQEVVKKPTVFINDVAIEVASGPFDVREAFGDDAVLIHSSGQPVLTNEWGVTLHSLQHGSFYYLVRMLAPPHTSMHLI